MAVRRRRRVWKVRISVLNMLGMGGHRAYERHHGKAIIECESSKEKGARCESAGDDQRGEQTSGDNDCQRGPVPRLTEPCQAQLGRHHAGGVGGDDGRVGGGAAVVHDSVLGIMMMKGSVMSELHVRRESIEVIVSAKIGRPSAQLTGAAIHQCHH